VLVESILSLKTLIAELADQEVGISFPSGLGCSTHHLIAEAVLVLGAGNDVKLVE
jgi:hypothetical protein